MSGNTRNLFAIFAVLLAVSAASVLLDRLRDPSSNSTSEPVVEATAPAEAVPTIDPEFDAAQEELASAKSELLGALNASKLLESEGLAPVKENLGFFESAVVEVLAALSDNPDDPTLRQTLLEIYRNQVALLEKALRISE